MNERYTLIEDDYEPLIRDNGKTMSSQEIVDCLNNQNRFIDLLFNELVEAQKQGYVVEFLHKNERCSLMPKELGEDE